MILGNYKKIGGFLPPVPHGHLEPYILEYYTVVGFPGVAIAKDVQAINFNNLMVSDKYNLSQHKTYEACVTNSFFYKNCQSPLCSAWLYMKEQLFSTANKLEIACHPNSVNNLLVNVLEYTHR